MMPMLVSSSHEDPLGFDAGDANLKRYVENNVTILVDPFGLQRSPPLPINRTSQSLRNFSGRGNIPTTQPQSNSSLRGRRTNRRTNQQFNDPFTYTVPGSAPSSNPNVLPPIYLNGSFQPPPIYIPIPLINPNPTVVPNFDPLEYPFPVLNFPKIYGHLL
jgi:hypothetical protein